MAEALRTRLFSRLIIDPQTGCLTWAGARDSKGYGHIGSGPPVRKQLRTHRVMYEMFVDSIPDEMEIDHLCRNRGCASPAHLEAVSHRENTLRGTSPSALGAQQTHCVRNHEFTPDNTRLTPEGWRVCRACHRESNRLYKARRRTLNA